MSDAFGLDPAVVLDERDPVLAALRLAAYMVLVDDSNKNQKQ